MNYQTLVWPGDNIIDGVFPTKEWFGLIRNGIAFKNKSVLDVGCNTFMLGILALLDGAREAVGIDTVKDHLLVAQNIVNAYGLQDKTKLIHGSAKDNYISSNVVLLSMIIHWLYDGPAYLSTINEDNNVYNIAIIHRLPNPGYQIPINGKWFPTTEELSQHLDNFTLIYNKVILTQDNNKQTALSIFRRSGEIRNYGENGNVISHVRRVGNQVYKTTSKLSGNWANRFEALKQHLDLPAFLSLTQNGYITRYIDGVDLLGDKPFQYHYNRTEIPPLSKEQKKTVARIFRDVLVAGAVSGLYLADFNQRCVLLKGDKGYLIDYDIIVDEATALRVYPPIWQATLDLLDIKYKFDGDLSGLITVLDKVSS